MIDVFFGESRITITDELRRELEWVHGAFLKVTEEYPGVWRVALPGYDSRLWMRGARWYFEMGIPGIVRGRLNGARGVEGKVEAGTLVIDVRNLLAPNNP